MIDLLKKAALTGLGVATLTTEKIEELAKDLTDKGKMTEQEGEKFIQEMIKKAEESKEFLKAQTESVVQNALDKVQLVKSEDLEILKLEIEKLRLEIESLKEQNKKEG